MADLVHSTYGGRVTPDSLRLGPDQPWLFYNGEGWSEYNLDPSRINFDGSLKPDDFTPLFDWENEPGVGYRYDDFDSSSEATSAWERAWDNVSNILNDVLPKRGDA